MPVRIRRLAGIAATVAALTLTAASPALADPSPGPSTSGKDAGERGKKVCARLPQLEARADKVLARLKGGADQPGSVAFTRKRAERARANGHADLATALESRATARADMIPVLEKKKAGLPQVTAWCTAHGYPAGS